MPDQVKGMIIDSDIKFECRLLMFAIQAIKMTDDERLTLVEIVEEITKFENIRLAGKIREVV